MIGAARATRWVSGTVLRRRGSAAVGSGSINGVALPLGNISIRCKSDGPLEHAWEVRLSLQGYYIGPNATPATFSESLDIFDVQLQHSLQPIGIHAVAWAESSDMPWIGSRTPRSWLLRLRAFLRFLPPTSIRNGPACSRRMK